MIYAHLFALLYQRAELSIRLSVCDIPGHENLEEKREGACGRKFLLALSAEIIYDSLTKPLQPFYRLARSQDTRSGLLRSGPP